MPGRKLIAGAIRGSDDHRATCLAAEHGADLGGVVDDLIHGDQEEVEGHDLDDRALAHHRGADTGSDEALLGDRRVAHAVGPELVQQSCRDLVRAVERADLLAHHEHALIAAELLAQRQPDRLAIGHHVGPWFDHRHRPSPPSKTRSSSPNALPGRMRENCSALPGAYMPTASSFTGGVWSADANATAAWTRSSTSRSSSASSSSDMPSASSRRRASAIGSLPFRASISSWVR